jgi:aminoglycoside 6'-N-acetyltransferase I
MEKVMVEIRPAGEQDLAELAGVFVACFSAPPWNEPWSSEAARKRLQMMLSAPTARALVAVENGAVVGMALGQVEGWLNGNLFLVQELCVLPSRQRVGIGQSLLQALCAKVCKADEVMAVYLLTDAESPAEVFYCQQGFARSSEKVLLGAAAKHLIKQVGEV